MNLDLIRISSDPVAGTFGVLKWDSKSAPFALTCEDDWKNNEPFVSCIPVGQYDCKLINSPKFGKTFQVLDVPGRSHILFHKGNTHNDTSGCILVGEQYGALNMLPAVLSSARGFDEFMYEAERLGEFSLNIRNANRRKGA